jgi:hypothetical protein
MRLYFETDTPQVVVRTGFHSHDVEDWYRDGVRLQGVSLSDRPLAAGAGVCLEVPADALHECEVESSPPYRQFVVPLAALAGCIAMLVD